MKPRVALALLVVGCVLPECSLWVSADPAPIGCADEGKIGQPACDTGYVCVEHACVRCVSAEICADGVDNDCNGLVDDGCSHVSSGGGGGHGGRWFSSAGGAAKTAGSGGSP